MLLAVRNQYEATRTWFLKATHFPLSLSLHIDRTANTWHFNKFVNFWHRPCRDHQSDTDRTSGSKVEGAIPSGPSPSFSEGWRRHGADWPTD